MILHVVDTDGKSFYVTEMNAVDAATGQARVIFLDPAQGKTFVHLYSEFFRVVTTVDEEGNEAEVPQYQVVGVVDEVPAGTVQAEGTDRSPKKKKSEKHELKTRPVRVREPAPPPLQQGRSANPKPGAEAQDASPEDELIATAPTFSVSLDDDHGTAQS